MKTLDPLFLECFFDQIESQVQFGDSKASLLVAGDAILLAVSGNLIKFVSGCPGAELTVSCLVPSLSLGFALITAALLTLSLVFALLAARPARIHDRPSSELFLFSHIAKMDRNSFVKMYIETPPNDLIQHALSAIHGKAEYATRKFRLLKRAIDATLLSLGFMVATLVVAIGTRMLL